MYKFGDKLQHSFLDFNQPIGMHLNPDNRWIKLAEKIPWDYFEAKYASLFPSKTGNVAKPLRMALGALIIQTKFQYADRELVQQITENAYLQYFIGLSGYQDEAPFDPSDLVDFRKRISLEILNEANDYIIGKAKKDDDKNDKPGDGQSGGNAKDPENAEENKGTVIVDASCSTSYIRYPQDFSLLNEAREKLERMITRFCKTYCLKKPRTYAKKGRKSYLALAKCKKRSTRKIRRTVREQLGFVRRDLKYLEAFMTEGYAPEAKEIKLLLTIFKLYEQQEYMYKNKVHSVQNRIVSISQPFLRPIVRGKVKAPVEFGAKYDLSLNEDGYGRIEKISFDPYNESTCLIESVERYHERTGRYPERVLADQIYRTRENRGYCKEHGIRLSGPRLGRPFKDNKADAAIEYSDNTDRIEVERYFSLAKRYYNIGLIKTKLEETTLTTIALSVLVTNLFKVLSRLIFEIILGWQNRLISDRQELKFLASPG